MAVLLQGGERCAVYVTFAPSAESAFSDTLTIGSDDPDEELVEIPLEGAGGTASEISMSPESIDFGPVLVGNTARGLFTIQNIGNLPLILDEMPLLNTDDFSVETDLDYSSGVTEPCGSFDSAGSLFELAEGEVCGFSLEFAPGDHGVMEETLEIVSNDPNHSSVFASLTGGDRHRPGRCAQLG